MYLIKLFKLNTRGNGLKLFNLLGFQTFQFNNCFKETEDNVIAKSLRTALS